MIIAWVLSLLFIISTVVVYLERIVALETFAVQTQKEVVEDFIKSEKIVLQCEQLLPEKIEEASELCHVQLLDKQYWLVRNLHAPKIEVLIHLNTESGMMSRLNWRQVFE
jgi:hypothetical protein